jgi:Rod binding domain-containing protein
MNITASSAARTYAFNDTAAAGNALQSAEQNGSQELREKFDAFVGETFYTQMLSSLRKTVHKPAYFHGGRAEEVFQGQLDQMLSQELTKASAGQFSGPMFELFMLGRS